MNRHTFAAVALAVLLVSAGAVAAAPGNAPTDAGADASDDSRGENAGSGDAAAAANGTDRAANASDGNATANGDVATDRSENASAAGDEARVEDSEGPDVALPERVPEHVSRIHDLVGRFLAGDLGGSLGEAISGLTADENAEPASG